MYPSHINSVLCVVFLCFVLLQRANAFNFNSILQKSSRSYDERSRILRDKSKSYDENGRWNRLKQQKNSEHGIPSIIVASSMEVKAARALGYVLMSGSLALYVPMIYDLITTKNANGYSLQTWVCTWLGLSLALIYPFKKGFALSTYIEVLALSIQSFFIVGIVCAIKGRMLVYALGTLAFAALSMFLSTATLSSTVLSCIQVFAMIVCNYSLVPQIVLNYRLKSSRYSPITSLLSSAGNAIRIFTTIQLTKDSLVMSGYILGLVMNLTLLIQHFLYKAK